FWGELEANISQILGGATGSALRTSTDPRITAAEQNPDSDLEDNTDGDDDTPDVILNVESLPLNGDGAAGGSDGGNPSVATFSLNRQAGMITIYATKKQHSEVENYLIELRRSVTSQVLIEAKIFEVNLFDEYITGIDWQALSVTEGLGNFLSTAGATSLNSLNSGSKRGLITPPNGSVTTTSNFTLGYAGNDLEALVQAISGFGTVRALASPRLTTLNNQSAVLNVATNQVFFEIDLESTDEDDDGTIDTVEVDSSIKSVPEGVLVNVQPSINLSTRKISLALRPTVTRIVGTERDPGVAFVASTIPGASNLQSEIPEVNVQEIDTVVNVSSGQPIVMGGLLQDRMANTQEGIPVLGEMPVVGSLFRTQKDLIQKTELVIFIKATIIDSGDDTVHPTDKDLYRKFSGDRRPLKL
ncbi:MAG: type II and III secretion system family protein, partial [Alphaproteobacteria bacterium]|nr:type II and III secretion system family protein [Alphaproteobacteria bacterium]